VTFVPRHGINGIKALRAVLKSALRAHGLRAIDAREIRHDERNQGEKISMDILSDDQTAS
jgi:hypothetical protein